MSLGDFFSSYNIEPKITLTVRCSHASSASQLEDVCDWNGPFLEPKQQKKQKVIDETFFFCKEIQTLEFPLTSDPLLN